MCGRVVGEQRKRARARCQRGRGRGTRGRVHRGTVTRWKGRDFWQFPLLFLRKMVLVCFVG